MYRNISCKSEQFVTVSEFLSDEGNIETNLLSGTKVFQKIKDKFTYGLLVFW